MKVWTLISFLFFFQILLGQIDIVQNARIDKVSRNIMGRTLNEDELKTYIKLEKRDSFWLSILNSDDFIDHNYRILRFEYLQGVDDEELLEALIDFEQIRLFQGQQGRAFGEPEFQKLYNIYQIPKDYLNSNMDIEEVQIRLINNYLYDQINMGVNNFVNTAFAYLLGRTPTQSELRRGIAMCENESENLFFKNGNSREDFLNILTQNDNYLEYQVRFWTEKIFFNEPSQKEINQILDKTLQRDKELNLKNVLVTIIQSFL